MIRIPIADVMSRDLRSIPYGTSLRAAAQSLLLGDADVVLVHHDDGRLAGLLSEHELVFGAQSAAAGGPAEVGPYATGRFVTAQVGESVADVARRMAQSSARRAVVVDDDHVPCGVISLHAGRSNPIPEQFSPERRAIDA